MPPATTTALLVASDSGGPASAPSQANPSFLGLTCWCLTEREWEQGNIVQFCAPSTRPQVYVAANDGTFRLVDMEHVRHGDKPPMLPRLATDFSAANRPHTLRLYQGKWLLARPDGRMLREYPNDEVGQRDAQAHWERLEPEIVKLKAIEAKPA